MKITNAQNHNGERAKRFKHDGWHLPALFLMLYDIIAVSGAYFVALWLRFDCRYSEIPQSYLGFWLRFIPFYAVATVVVFWFFKLYNSLWRFASFVELKRLLCASALLGVLHTVGITLIFGRMPSAYYIVGIALQFMLTIAVRFAYRFILLERSKYAAVSEASAKNVMLIGAGDAGQMILRDLHVVNKSCERVVCIIDDDKSKWGCYIDGVPIVGGRDEILLSAEKYGVEKIYLAIPSATAEQRRDILNVCKETTCELKNLPGFYQYVSGDVSANQMRDVAVEDLLGRDPVNVCNDEIFRFIEGKTILVTGGGGSIGSELCRQIAEHSPKLLIIFDIYENNAHAIRLELRDKYPNLNLEVLIGSVRDSIRINGIFEKYRPDIVYHAAAHKHVPLMEDSPCETIKNNVIGTYKTAYAALAYGCRRFVLISTDKAVNPTNIMGASKRLCEMIIQTFAKKVKEQKTADLRMLHLRPHCDEPRFDSLHPTTEFVAVRFGNVLGSNGSVIPRFKEQIAKGGPVTVTHPDIIRYFMTIPEAASLVLQAGTYAEGGEIFVLDMGQPVKIDTLARNLIRLSGLKPDEDIKISYIGLRPGEKLYEEKLMDEEGLTTTPNHQIYIGKPLDFDTDAFLDKLRILMDSAYNEREDEIRTLVKDAVPTYSPEGEKDGAFAEFVKKTQAEAVC